ncbi:MAG: POTRA domain-containing protein [Bacteroidota bacterium]
MKPFSHIWTLILLLLATPSWSGEPSLRIESITIVRKNIFDASREDQRHVFGSVVNAVHIPTRESVIRSELLFQEGEVFDMELLKESERSLRALGYIGDVAMRCDTLSDSTVAVTVETHDKWTIDMLPAYKQGGGVEDFRFSLKDDNFLGGGQSLSLSYNYRSDRPDPHGMDITFLERNLLGTRVSTLVRHRNTWDHTYNAVRLERGYFSDRATWAGGVYAELGRQRLLLYDEGAIVHEEVSGREVQSAWASVSLGEGPFIRPMISYTRARSNFAMARRFDNLDLVTVGVSLLGRRFVERSFLDNFGRVEDVPIGAHLGVSVGKNIRGGRTQGVDYSLHVFWMHSWLFGERNYWGWSASYQSYFEGSQSSESTLEMTLLHHWKISRYQTFVARVSMAAGFGWSGLRQLLLGASTGLRGYDEYSFQGDRRIIYGFEHRVFTDVELFIFRLGAVAFFDGGTAWTGGPVVGGQRFHHAVGCGLRIENTKLQGAGLIRIDWAMNLDRGHATQVILSSCLPFSAFLDLDVASPAQALDGF